MKKERSFIALIFAIVLISESLSNSSDGLIDKIKNRGQPKKTKTKTKISKSSSSQDSKSTKEDKTDVSPFRLDVEDDHTYDKITLFAEDISEFAQEIQEFELPKNLNDNLPRLSRFEKDHIDMRHINILADGVVLAIVRRQSKKFLIFLFCEKEKNCETIHIPIEIKVFQQARLLSRAQHKGTECNIISLEHHNRVSPPKTNDFLLFCFEKNEIQKNFVQIIGNSFSGTLPRMELVGDKLMILKFEQEDDEEDEEEKEDFGILKILEIEFPSKENFFEVSEKQKQVWDLDLKESSWKVAKIDPGIEMNEIYALYPQNRGIEVLFRGSEKSQKKRNFIGTLSLLLDDEGKVTVGEIKKNQKEHITSISSAIKDVQGQLVSVDCNFKILRERINSQAINFDSKIETLASSIDSKNLLFGVIKAKGHTDILRICESKRGIYKPASDIELKFQSKKIEILEIKQLANNDRIIELYFSWLPGTYPLSHTIMYRALIQLYN